MHRGPCRPSFSRPRGGPGRYRAPNPAHTEPSEVVVDGGPRRGVAGQHSPGTAASQDVEDRVEDVAQGVGAHPTRQLRGQKVGLQAGPFFVGEVGGIGLSHARERTQLSQPLTLQNRLLVLFDLASFGEGTTSLAQG